MKTPDPSSKSLRLLAVVLCAGSLLVLASCTSSSGSSTSYGGGYPTGGT